MKKGVGVLSDFSLMRETEPVGEWEEMAWITKRCDMYREECGLQRHLNEDTTQRRETIK